jgi:hypothetical protein
MLICVITDNNFGSRASANFGVSVDGSGIISTAMVLQFGGGNLSPMMRLKRLAT